MAFGITYDVVLGAADQLRAQNARLTEIVDRMQSTAKARFADWNALSVDTYVTTENTWEQQAGVMQADLESSVKRLLEKVANYQDADRRASQI